MSVKISRAECDDEKRRGAAALRELLDLNGALGDPPVREQIEGVIGIGIDPIPAYA